MNEPISQNIAPANKNVDSIQSSELNAANSEKTSLQKQRSDLEGKQDFWNSWYLGLAVGAVFLGLASWATQKFSSDNAYRARDLSTRITAIDGRIRDIQDKQSSAQIESIKSDALNAKLESDQKIAELNVKAAALSKDAAEATRKFGAEEIARLKLEAEIQPRQYSLEQQDRISSACVPFRDHSLIIRSQPYDVEGAVFATSLADLLKSRTQLVLRTDGIGNNFMQNLPMFFDVEIAGPLNDIEFIDMLVKVLSTSSIPVHKSVMNGSTTIFVGAKRLPSPTPANKE